MKKPTKKHSEPVIAADTSLPQEAMPLFYTQAVPINVERHGNASILPMQNCKFAAKTNSIPINAGEFIEIAKYYPIVFTNDDPPMPAALVGLEQSNYFVNAEGIWKQDVYVPAYVRKYPFIFTHILEQKQLVLCVDETSEQFCPERIEGAIAFYDSDRKPSEFIRSTMEFSMHFHNHYVHTRQFTRDLKETELLTPHNSTLTLFNGRQVHLQGFQMIDEKKFLALPEDKILEFYKKGWLPFIYYALMSVSNWKRLSDMASLLESNTKAS